MLTKLARMRGEIAKVCLFEAVSVNNGYCLKLESINSPPPAVHRSRLALCLAGTTLSVRGPAARWFAMTVSKRALRPDRCDFEPVT